MSNASIVRRAAVGLAATLVCNGGCAADPPRFPERTSTAADATDDGRDVPSSADDGDDETAGATEDLEEDDGGATDVATVDDGSSGGGSSSGPAAMDDGASGTGGDPPPDPWFVGCYAGDWDMQCTQMGITINGDGTWDFCVDADGIILGMFEGTLGGMNVGDDFEGEIDENGNWTSTAQTGLGTCNWEGEMDANGVITGDFTCGYGCSGSIEGTLEG